MILDKKLNFIPHINYIKNKCNKALQLLRVIAPTNWGADKETLLKLYRTLIRSKIEYGCFLCKSARKSYLKILTPIYHTSLRLALRVFQISPVESLYAELYESPPKLRCNNLPLKYYIKLKAGLTNPAHSSIFRLNVKLSSYKKKKTIKTFGLRMESICLEANIPITKHLPGIQWLPKQI